MPSSVFTGKTGLRECHIFEPNGKVWSKEDLPSVEEDQVREHLNKLNTPKCMRLNGI